MFASMMVLGTANCFAAPVVPATRGQSTFTLDQLMKLLARRTRGEVRFEETDYLAILDRPVKSSGVLVYDAPGHLEKRTLRPEAESLILDGDMLTVRRGRQAYRMEVSAYPQVAPYVDAIRDTLAGDEGALERVFEVGFAGDLGGWKLELAPRDAKGARRVRSVTIEGARDEIRSVEILQADGDRSVMMVGPPPAAAGPRAVKPPP